MTEIKPDDLWLCRKMVQLPKTDYGTAYEYWEPIREYTPASPDAVREALERLEILVLASDKEMGSDDEEAFRDDEDVSHPASGITFGMLRQAKRDIAVLKAQLGE